MSAGFGVTPRGVGATHVEIYLSQQVAILFVGGRVRLITHISSGSGQAFCTPDHCSVAVTPPGTFRFGGRVSGWQNGTLGLMYNPVYFNGNIAMHGSLSVPNYPASHGCVRLPMGIASYFPSLVHTG